MTKSLRIDIVSDVMCPWCLVGYRQLARALEDTGTAHEIQWHPFELNPQMLPEGQNLHEHIVEKYGTTPEQSEQARRQITAIGNKLGFAFRYTKDMRMHNTYNAHQLLHWAREKGRMHDLKQALFTAHFTSRRDLSNIAVLADVASEIGLDPVEALTVLMDQRHADEVRVHEDFWLRQGIQGVPAIIFDSQHLVTGAQGVENYTNILKRLVEMKD